MKSKKKVCSIDLDGIFTSYPRCWLEYLERRTGKYFDSLEIAKRKLPRENYLDLKKAYRSSDFKYNLQPTPGSADFTKFLQKKGYFVVIVTARPESHPRLKERTRKWLWKNDIFYDELLFVKKKLDILSKYPQLSFGVDDEIEDCQAIAKRGYKIFLVDNYCNNNMKYYTSVTTKYNQQTLDRNIILVHNFEDILRRL